jgi:TPR repeat protein
MRSLGHLVAATVIFWVTPAYAEDDRGRTGQTKEDIRRLYFQRDIARMQELATEGNPRAESTLALMLRQRGKGAEALAWYLRAAEKDDLFAIGELARYYNNQQRNEEAARWYRRGAELGQVDHQFEYANLLLEGSGVEANPREAFGWYQSAASRNYWYAYLPLARLYAGGIGTDRDLAKALALVERAAVEFEKGSDDPTLFAQARALRAQVKEQLDAEKVRPKPG